MTGIATLEVSLRNLTSSRQKWVLNDLSNNSLWVRKHNKTSKNARTTTESQGRRHCQGAFSRTTLPVWASSICVVPLQSWNRPIPCVEEAQENHCQALETSGLIHCQHIFCLVWYCILQTRKHREKGVLSFGIFESWRTKSNFRCWHLIFFSMASTHMAFITCCPCPCPIFTNTTAPYQESVNDLQISKQRLRI